MEQSVRGLLSFLSLYHKLAEGDISNHELFGAYQFLRKYLLPDTAAHAKITRDQKEVASRVLEGAPTGEATDPFPLSGNKPQAPGRDSEVDTGLVARKQERRFGAPKTDEERRERHEERFDTRKLPPRGTGLNRMEKLANRFLSKSPSRVDAALAVDAFVHEVHSYDCTLLGKAFNLDPELATDMALPLFDTLAGKTKEDPIRKQVRGYATPWLESAVLLKSEKPIIVAGYASVELVDRENHLIPRETLEKAFREFMSRDGRANIQFAHSNYQAGKVLAEWKSPSTGETFVSGVDEKGLFVVGEVYPDTTIGKRIVDEISKGDLRAFSISGLGKKVVQKNGFKEVQDLELYEITICAEPVNQGAFFKVVKGELPVEKIRKIFQKALPLGWTVSVDGSISLPFGYKDIQLEKALGSTIGSFPSLHGTYELELKPVYVKSDSLKLDDCVSLTGTIFEKTFPTYGYSFLINHPKGSPLGIAIYRSVSKALPLDLKKSVQFVFEPEERTGVYQPLLTLCARKVERVERST